MKLMGKRIMVRPGIREHKSASGLLVIPDTAVQLDDTHGEVIGVAADAEEVEVGDHVLFSPHVGLDIEFDGGKVIVMFEKDIIGVMNKE